MRETEARLTNCPTAPRMSMAASMYMRKPTNTVGMSARMSPRMRLPSPTMGNCGLNPVSCLPLASNTCGMSLLRRAAKYVAHDTTPDRKNSTPMAIVIHVTVCSRYFTSNAPTITAHKERTNELCITFIFFFFFMLFLCGFTFHCHKSVHCKNIHFIPLRQA